ncbi:toxin-antitoxin system YwqK family antitoxin [Bacteroidota bacterium]
MNKLSLITLLLFSINLHGQNLPSNFKIGENIEVFSNDSLQFYFNCAGNIVDKDCADFMRKGRIDSVCINIVNEFNDYYIDGSLALKAHMFNDYLNGNAIYYYKNGKIKSTGNYKNDLKIGVWKYYYDNGQLEKVLDYQNSKPLILEYYSKNGKQKVIEGNGNYKGYFNSFLSCKSFGIKGKVVNGKMEGKWSMYYPSFNNKIGIEYFENGIFVKGESMNRTYYDNEKIIINGYSANESVFLHESRSRCLGDRVLSFKYKGEGLLHENYYPKLLDSIIKTNPERLNNQWLIIGLKISSEIKTENINVKSSINDTVLENKIHSIIFSMNKWIPNHDYVDAQNDWYLQDDWNVDKITFIEHYGFKEDWLFFSILIKDSQIIIPAEYKYRKQ